MSLSSRVETVIASLYLVEPHSIVPIIGFVFATWRDKNNSLIKHNVVVHNNMCLIL